MPMQNHMHTTRYLTRIRRDMCQIKPQPLSLQCERKWPPHLPITVSPHHKQRHSELPKLQQSTRIADIAQMPNLISRARRKPLRQPQRKPIMSIRKHSNAHKDKKTRIYTSAPI